jgi:hypothetical protein
MQDTSQLIASIILGSLSLISDPTLRYTALGMTALLALIYIIYLKHPATQLRQLQDTIEKMEDLIQQAKLNCRRDHLSLAALGVRLLECAFTCLNLIRHSSPSQSQPLYLCNQMSPIGDSELHLEETPPRLERHRFPSQRPQEYPHCGPGTTSIYLFPQQNSDLMFSASL